MEKERRYSTNCLRAKRSEDQNTAGTIYGYAAKFNVISEDLGGFREVLLPGCFDLENSPDVICNREHCDDDPLGRTTSGTLTVAADEIGLSFECRVANTTLGRDTLVLITPRGDAEFGDLNACSFAFVIDGEDGEEWGETEDGTPLRKIKRCTLFDVSCVAHAAYPQTELALRNLKRATETKAAPCFVRQRARLQLASKALAYISAS